MPPPKPPDTLDFQLARICHLHYMRVHQLLEALGLYRGQPGILHALWDKEGLTQTELAANLHNTPATVTSGKKIQQGGAYQSHRQHRFA